MAAFALLADWCKTNRRPLPIAVTVDHGLREASAGEAKQVAKWIGKLGARHETLIWCGDKPSGNVQAAARGARYRLIGEWAQARKIATLVTGHTLDDQAETFLLRLARGSGLEGLSGMAALAPFPLRGFEGLSLARPLLGLSHARLVATLQARCQSWIEDPSNASSRYERARLRQSKPELEALGLTSERLAQTTVHLRRAMEVVDDAVTVLLERAVQVSPWGYALVRAREFAAARREVALRALARLLAAIGGELYAPRFEALEAVCTWLGESDGKGRTLGGCRLARRSEGAVLIAREESAISAEPVPLKAGDSSIWDGRFRVVLRQGGPFELRGLGAKGLALADPAADLPPLEPRLIAKTTPALWTGGRLAHAPLLKYSAVEAARAHVSVEFLGLAKGKGAAKGNGL